MRQRSFRALLLMLAALPFAGCAAAPTPQTVASIEADEPAKRSGGAAVDVEPLVLHAFDVGQGDCALVETGDYLVMVDCGSSGGRDFTDIQDDIQATIDQRPIDYLFVTHPDSDHFNLLPWVLHGVEIKNIVLGGKKSDYSASFRKWLESTKAKIKLLGKKVHSPPDAPYLSLAQTKAYILSANFGSSKDKNSESIVLKFLVPGKSSHGSLVLTGDATAKSENAILSYYDDSFLRTDVLKLAHHGSSESSTSDFLKATKPAYAYASAGNAWYLHPRCDVFAGIRALKSPVDVSCHRLSCGDPAIDDDCDSPQQGWPWCVRAEDTALFNTFVNGNLRFTLNPDDQDDPIAVEVSRGKLHDSECSQ